MSQISQLTSGQVLVWNREIRNTKNAIGHTRVISKKIKRLIMCKHADNMQKYPKTEHTIQAVHKSSTQACTKMQVLWFKPSTKTVPSIYDVWSMQEGEPLYAFTYRVQKLSIKLSTMKNKTLQLTDKLIQ